MSHLVILFFIVVLKMFPVSPEVTAQQKGFCVISWVTQEMFTETYTYTEYGYRDNCYRYSHYCYQPLTKTGNRQVFKDVKHEKVECCEGYEKRIFHEDHFDCVPVCEPECVDGHCTAPGNCTCFQGYRHLNSSRCVPLCSPECTNGVCISPGTCQCNEGYIKVNLSYCSPNCSSPCINGVCIQPEECLCNNGFEKTGNDRFMCKPICKNECINSTCVDINICSCYDGYIKGDPSKPNVCVPGCSLECINGDCTAPDTCTCKDEYKLGNESWNVCRPNCNCTNGYCLEPNRCICFDNYTLDEYGDCEPVCSGCVNATCTSPSYCECLSGFKRFNDTVCIPECSNCVNGNCEEPEVCNCLPGYVDNELGGCEPVCNFGCANGICTAPNDCSCKEGYEKVEENLCFPNCSLLCTNCSETDCVALERTNMITLQPHIKTIPIVRLHLHVHCSTIRRNDNTSCILDSSQKNQCPFLSLECVPIKNIETSWKLLCFMTEMNYTYEAELIDVLYNENLNITTNNYRSVNTTLLLPKYLLNGEGSCDLCAHSVVNSSTETNSLTFELIPCLHQEGEYFTRATDNVFVYGGIAFGIGTILVLMGLITFFYRQKFKQHSVSSQVKFKEENVEILKNE